MNELKTKVLGITKEVRNKILRDHKPSEINCKKNLDRLNHL